MAQTQAPTVNFRRSPLLVKPNTRSRHDALPSALHMGACVTLSLLLVAIIDICVAQQLGPKNTFTNLVQAGTMMAMITILILGTPNLGNSLTKAIQRITGVMIGGWLFFGLYAGCQQWWFLVICLTAWAFLLVSLSFALSGREFLFPVALVTSFMVVCNFDSVQQALVMTVVKTVAFSGAIVLYTLVSLVVLPLTATQQLLTNLALALQDLEQLADLVLVRGTQAAQEEATPPLDTKDLEAPVVPHPTVAAADFNLGKAASRGVDAAMPPVLQSIGTVGKKGTAGGKRGGAEVSLAVGLAADANHKLQLVQQLLRMTKKEQYVGVFGTYKCFMPSLSRTGALPEETVLAVVINAGQVLRVLTTIMSDYGQLPLASRPAPASLSASAAQQLEPLAQQAVAALQDISSSLPVQGPSSRPVPLRSLQAFSSHLQQLVSSTVQACSGSIEHQQMEAAVEAAERDATAGGAGGAVAPSSGAAKWQQTAKAAGAVLPLQQHQQIAAEFGRLLGESVLSEEGQLARWCSLLVQSRQLGRSIAGLMDSTNEMLAVLPWVQDVAAGQ